MQVQCSPTARCPSAQACAHKLGNSGSHLILVARALAVLGQSDQALHHQFGVALVHKHAKSAHGAAAQHCQELDRFAHEVDVDRARAAQVVLGMQTRPRAATGKALEGRQPTVSARGQSVAVAAAAAGVQARPGLLTWMSL